MISDILVGPIYAHDSSLIRAADWFTFSAWSRTLFAEHGHKTDSEG